MSERWSWPQILFAPCQSPLHYKLKINHNMNGFQSLFDLWVFINCGQYLLISVWLLAWNQSKPKVSPTQGIFPTGAWGRCLARPCLGRALFSRTKVSITESKTWRGLWQKFCELHYKTALFTISQANRQVKLESEVLWRIAGIFRIEKYKAIIQIHWGAQISRQFRKDIILGVRLDVITWKLHYLATISNNKFWCKKWIPVTPVLMGRFHLFVPVLTVFHGNLGNVWKNKYQWNPPLTKDS